MTAKDKLPYDTEYALLRVIEQEINLHDELEQLREDLFERRDFNLIDGF